MVKTLMLVFRRHLVYVRCRAFLFLWNDTIYQYKYEQNAGEGEDSVGTDGDDNYL